MATQDMKAKLVIETSAQGNGDIVKLRDELDKLAGSADQAGPEFGALAAEINKLGAQQAAIDGFEQLKLATAETAQRTQQLQQATRDAALALKEKQAALEAATAAEQAQSSQLAQARTEQSAMGVAIKQLGAELKAMAQEAKASGDSSAVMAQRLSEGSAQLAALKAQYKTASTDVAGFAQAQRDSATAAKAVQRETGAAQKEFDGLRQSSVQAKQALAGQNQELQHVRDALGGMGISSKALAASQVQLNQGLDASRASLDALAKKAEEAAAVLANRELLGVRAHAELQDEIEKTREAYEQLKASGTLTNAELAQAAQQMEARVRELTEQTDGWAVSLEEVASALAGVVASGAGLAAVANQAIKFESAMADVEKVVNGTQEQMAALAGRIKDMTATIPLAATELAGLAAAGGQLGIPIEKLGEFIDLSATMGTAFTMSAEQAGQAVAKLSNVFKLPLEEVRNLGDAINVLGNTTAAREADIVDVLTRIGGTAQQFGLSAQQAAALGTAMLSLGVQAEVAGTGINAILSKLQTAGIQGKDFQLALGSMGVSAKQLAKDIRDNPQKALSGFLETLSKLEGGKQAEVLARLFGVEYQDDVARLVAGLEAYKKALNSASDKVATAGAMQKEFAVRIQTTEAQIKLLSGSIGTLSTNLGSVLLPVIRPLVGGLADASSALAKLSEQFPAVSLAAVGLTTMAASAGAMGLAYAAMRVAGVKSIEALAAAFPGLVTRLGGAAAAATALKLSLGSVAGVLSAAAIGWDTGTYLVKQFAVVEQAGLFMAQGLAVNFAVVQGEWEKLKAVFTDDTIAAAQQRLSAKLKQINVDFAEMRIAAAQARAALEGQAPAADAAAQAHTKVSTAVQAVTTKMQELAASTQAAGQSAQATSVQLEQVFAQAIKGAASVGVVGQLRDKLQEAQAAGQLTADAAARLRVQLDQVGAAVGGVKEVVAQFRALKDSSEGVQGAVDALVKSLDINDKGSVAVFAKALQELGSTGVLSAQQVDAAWQQALGSLNTRQLDNFSLAVKVAFAQGTLSAQEFAKVNEQILAASFDKLGVNAAQALGQISEGAQEAISSIDLVAESAKAAGVGVQDAARAIEMSFAAAIPKADSLQAIDALEQKLKAMGAAGQISAQGIERTQAALDKQRSAIEEQIPGIQSLTEALRQLGVKPQAELKAMAQAAKEAFEVVKTSGTATPREINEAWKAMAEASIAATNGVADASIQAQAKQHGFAIETDKAGKSTVKTLGEVKDATDAAGDSLEEAGKKGKDGLEKIDRAAQMAGKSVEELQAIKAEGWNIAEDMKEAADIQNAATNALTNAWRSARVQADEYYQTIFKAWAAAKSVGGNPWELEGAIWRASAALKDLDASQQALERSSGDATNGLEDLQDKLLELSGSEEEVAARRKERDEEAIQKKMALLELDLRRAQILKNNEEAAQLSAELKLYRQQLELLDQIARKEKNLQDEAKRKQEDEANARKAQDKKDAEAAERARVRQAEEDRVAQAAKVREAEKVRRTQEDAQDAKDREAQAQKTAPGGGNDGKTLVPASAPAPISITLNANGINDPVKLARLLEPELKKLSIRAR